MRRIPPGAPIVSAAAMRAAERALADAGVSQVEQMERAGRAVAREVTRFATGRPVLVLAGPGNNGGDAFAVARLLCEAGLDVAVAALDPAGEGGAAEMRARWKGQTVPLAQATPRPVLVDGLFGTGLTRPLQEEVRAALLRCTDAAEITVAIDLPSGLGTSDGADLGVVGADVTVAIQTLKPAHVLAAGLAACGTVFLVDIGIPAPPECFTLARPHLAAPSPGDHKYSRGMVVVVEGEMRGAGRLAARAALAGGAGYVIHTGAPDGLPDALVHRPAHDGKALATLLEDERIDAVVIGPGLGRNARAHDLFDAAWQSARPLVIDGDAFALLGDRGPREAPLFCTPHAGEFAATFGNGDSSKLGQTRDAAQRLGATIVHKGGDTVIARPEGQVTVHAEAPSWLSTAGTGDVLAGLIGARLAVAGEADAAQQAVWLHARAAQLAGPAFAADRLIDFLPAAIAECL